MSSLPYYVDDPAMDSERPKHRLEMEPDHVESARRGFRVFSASCPCGWLSPGLYDWNGHAEAYDAHMGAMQVNVHAKRGRPE